MKRTYTARTGGLSQRAFYFDDWALTLEKVVLGGRLFVHTTFGFEKNVFFFASHVDANVPFIGLV